MSDIVTTPMTFLDSLESNIQTRWVSSLIIIPNTSFIVASGVAVLGVR